MDLQHLRYFHEVAKQKSFSAAAKNLHISQPGVSKVIKQLEDSLGGALIDRRTRGFFKLTDLGENVFEQTTAIFDHVEQIVQRSKNDDKGMSGELNIGCSDYIASTFLPSKLKEYRNQSRSIDLKIWCGPSSGIRERLLNGELDLGLFFNDDPHPSLEYVKLGQVQFLAVGSPAMAGCDLKQSTFIGCTSLDYYRTYPALELLKILKITPPKIIEANNFHAQKELVKNDFGYAIFPDFAIAEDLKAKKMILIKTKESLKKNLILARRKGRKIPSLAKGFEEFLAR